MERMVNQESRWSTVSVPTSLLKYVEKYIEDHPELGISGVPEFVRICIREYLRVKK